MSDEEKIMKRHTGSKAALYLGRAALGLLICFGTVSADELRRQGFIGVKVVPVPEQTRSRIKLPAGQGILVEQVITGGSAEAAGLLRDDIIVKMNGDVIADVGQFISLVKKYRGGDTMQLSVLRAGRLVSKSVVVKPRPYESNPAADTLYQSVTVDGTKRRVIVTKPKAAGRYPAIFFVTGVGCGSQDNLQAGDTLAKVLYTLTERGFVTMRVEKSGVGDSEGPPCSSPEVDLQAEVRGYVAGLRALKSYDYVDGDRVIILGLSMGGIVGPMVAAEVPVKGLAVAETVGKSWFEYELENLRRQLLLKGLAYDETEKLERQKELCLHRLYFDKQTPEQIARDVPQCAQLPIQAPAPYTYMQQVANLNLAELWKKVDAPTLVIYGTSDFLTTAEEHQYLANLINSYHPGRATFVKIENMDHYLTRASSMRESLERSDPGEFQPAFLEELQRWLSRLLQPEQRG